jgi:hypothetical protein
MVTTRHTDALFPNYKYLGDTKLCLFIILEIGYREEKVVP